MLRVPGARSLATKAAAGAGPGCAKGCGAAGRVSAPAGPAVRVSPAHASREAVAREPCRGPRVTVPCQGAVSRRLQISPAAALDRVCHPVPAALDFPRSGVTVVPWLWLQGSTDCRWCQAVRGSGLYTVLGSPTSAALPVARTVILFWPPPLC